MKLMKIACIVQTSWLLQLNLSMADAKMRMIGGQNLERRRKLSFILFSPRYIQPRASSLWIPLDL
jgi:hypothetical protein